MLGKTHVIGSLALIHTGLLGYTIHANRIKHETAGTTGEYMSVFGLPIGEPLSLMEYTLVMVAVSCFIMLLLRIGGFRSRVVQTVLMVVSLIIIHFAASGEYPLTITIVLLSLALGTILPDIDSEDSTIGKYIKPISRAIPHRTITHSIWVVLLLGGLSWYFESIYLTALTLGYFLHIIQDSFSDKGIRWFYPIPNLELKRLRFPFSYEVGGLGETVVFISSIATHLLCVGYTIWMLI